MVRLHDGTGNCKAPSRTVGLRPGTGFVHTVGPVKESGQVLAPIWWALVGDKVSSRSAATTASVTSVFISAWRNAIESKLLMARRIINRSPKNWPRPSALSSIRRVFLRVGHPIHRSTFATRSMSETIHARRWYFSAFEAKVSRKDTASPGWKSEDWPVHARHL